MSTLSIKWDRFRGLGGGGGGYGKKLFLNILDTFTNTMSSCYICEVSCLFDELFYLSVTCCCVKMKNIESIWSKVSVSLVN